MILFQFSCFLRPAFRFAGRFYRRFACEKAEEAFKLIRLDDLPRCDELLERGNLGDLVTRRIVEQHPAPNFEANHKEKALEWLRSL